MITLYQFFPGGGLPNLSPFCLKLETWLRMAGLEFRVADTANPGKGPLGKLPAIGLEGRIIPDSTLCIATLEQRFGINLDAGLSEQELAVARAFKLLLEDHFYWTLLYSRWIDPQYWPATRQCFFGMLPPLVNRLVPVVAQRQIRQELRGHGMGRHTPEQIYDFAEQDLRAVSAFLADKPYLMGDAPSTLDATAYGFLAQVTLVQMESALQPVAANFPNLRAYCERMRARYFP